ncbi:cytochrome P450 78A4-like [Chenopodium quinoa]|uniref:Cytochrome P450 n=1 Tax=Chenopodium quinoa TaxID=63459 RepID=A0A803M6P1_CHEQI|nr:cytochrome P450 78A4-like [Chenopodium quinoa]
MNTMLAYLFKLPLCLETTQQTFFALVLSFLLYCLLHLWLVPGGFAWRSYNLNSVPKLRGPSGWPVLGTLPQMGHLAHRKLANIAASMGCTRLMAMSLGATPVIISSNPETAREILCSPSFSDRPIKPSARLLMFERAIGFAPHGTYWRHLRRISANHMFSPRRISSLEGVRQCLADAMSVNVLKEMKGRGFVELRGILQGVSLKNMLESVFGSNLGSEGKELGLMVREGYELISEFNLEEYFPFSFLDFYGVKRRCHKLAYRVSELLSHIIKLREKDVNFKRRNDFLSVLLSLPEEEQLSHSDMVAVLWETIFRGADTVATLLEWIMARMVLHQDVQAKAQEELDLCIGNSQRQVQDSDLQHLPFLQAIVKEVLRLHPPGPLLSWARLAIHDVHVDKVRIPAGTTAMVNMWAITHDPTIWADPWAFNPMRFINEDVSIMGSDLRLAPFGSGRRVCPGRALGLATVHLWLARMLHQFNWFPAPLASVDLSECLRLSLEMKKPLACLVVPRNNDVKLA